MSYPPLNALRVFEAAARRGSFSAAAEDLCVTQSAVSHQIRHLEDWFGGPLFEREGNRLRLLPHGTALARTLGAAFGEIETACRRARRASGPPKLVIAAIPSIAICWLIPRLAEFRQRHPEIAIRVVYALHGHEIDFGDVDLALVFSQGAPRRENMRATVFLSGSSAPVCSPALAERIGDRSLLDDLLEAGLLHDTSPDGWRNWFSRAGAAEMPSVSGPIFEDFNLLRAAALAGQGVALCALALIGEDIRAGRLVLLSDVTVNEDFDYYLVEHPSLEPATREAADAFKTWLFAARDHAAPAAGVAPPH